MTLFCTTISSIYNMSDPKFTSYNLIIAHTLAIRTALYMNYDFNMLVTLQIRVHIFTIIYLLYNRMLILHNSLQSTYCDLIRVVNRYYAFPNLKCDRKKLFG